MKKTIIALGLMMAMGAAFEGCQKEQITPQTLNGITASSTTLMYSVNGVVYSYTYSNDEERQLFFDRIMALVNGGAQVRVWNASNLPGQSSAKEVITFTTTSETEAKNWAELRTQEGYSVSISFNEETGIYTCRAYR